MKRRTTLRDIAKALNVSVTTVSRALNDRTDISPLMKQRVKETAQILDYKPNTVARSLRKKTSSQLLGVIVPQLDHYFYSTIVKGVTMAADGDDDYAIIIGESNHSPTREMKLIDQYSDHYVAGLIFIPSRSARSYPNVQELISRQLPFILIDRTFDRFHGSYIRYDDYDGAYQATKHLIEQGRTKIALLRGDKDCSISTNRHRGYTDALKEAGIKSGTSYIKSCTEASKSEAYKACKELWALDSPPDAVFTVTDQLAAGVYDFAHDMNLRIPEDIAVVGYSNSEISDILYPRLTTIAQNGQLLGQMAKRHIIDALDDRTLQLQHTVDTKLVIRRSSLSQP